MTSQTRARALVRTVGVMAAAAVASIGLGAGAVIAPAAAAPTTPRFTLPIDGYAPYSREDTCSPTPKPGAVAMVDLLKRTYGTAIATNIVRPCSASVSGHEQGRSVDWMTNVRKPAQKAVANDFIAWLLAPDAQGNAHAMARRMGVSYLIWDSRILVIGPTAQWTEYSGCLTKKTSPTYDTTCHRDHVHVSLGWPGARAQTTWYTQPPMCTTSGRSTRTAAVKTASVRTAGARLTRTTCQVATSIPTR